MAEPRRAEDTIDSLPVLARVLGFFIPGVHAVCDPVGAAALALFAWFAKDK